MGKAKQETPTGFDYVMQLPRHWKLLHVECCLCMLTLLSTNVAMEISRLAYVQRDLSIGSDKVRLYIICLPEDGLYMIEESFALQGLNKTAAVAEFGEETVTKWRRSYDTRPPNGESLQVRD